MYKRAWKHCQQVWNMTLQATRARNEARKLTKLVTVVRLNFRDWHAERFGSVAG